MERHVINSGIYVTLQDVYPKVHIEVRLINYYNPKSRDYNDICCDGISWFGGCPEHCDTYFKICMRKCVTTQVVGKDDIYFGRHLGRNLLNPLKRHRNDPYPVSSEVFITYCDYLYYRNLETGR